MVILIGRKTDLAPRGNSRFGLKMIKQFVHQKEHIDMAKESKKSKIKTRTPEFLILSERLKEVAKLKANGKYHDRNFDKSIDEL